MASSDCEELSQLHLELVDAHKEGFMLQNEKVAKLKCFLLRKKMSNYLSISPSSSPKVGNGKIWVTRPSLKVLH